MSNLVSGVSTGLAPTTILECNGEELHEILKEGLYLVSFVENAVAQNHKLDLLSQLCKAVYDASDGGTQWFAIFRALFPPLALFTKNPDDIPNALVAQLMEQCYAFEDVKEGDIIKMEGHHRLAPTAPSMGIYGYKREDLLRLKQIFDKEHTELSTKISMMEPKIANSVALKIIPKDYLYPFALETMSGYVRNYTASTWKECVEKFEQQLHRWKMEINSEEGLRIQRETHRLAAAAERNSFWAATFSAASYFRK